MFTKLRNHLGIPGILAIAALVFAMIGGAYAASGPGEKASSSAKRGKPGKRGPKGATGATGAQGAAGAQGPAGAKGDAGAQGAQGEKGAAGEDGDDGAPGAAGKSVKVKPLTAGLQVECEETGGALVEEEDGSPKVPVCNGEQGEDGAPGPPGQPWVPDNTLPDEATLTGTWSFNATTADSGILEGAEAYAPINFPIKLADSLPEANLHYQGQAGFSTTCTGSVAEPSAPKEHLCAYTVPGAFGNVRKATFGSFLNLEGTEFTANPAGTILRFEITGNPASGFGSWAVTGFEPAP